MLSKPKIIITLSFLFIGLILVPLPQEEEQNIKYTDSTLKSEILNPRTSREYSKNFANLTEHAWEVQRVKFSPNGQILASGSHDGSIKLWDMSSGEVIITLQGHYYSVISLAFSPDGLVLASGGWGKKINFWNVTTGALIKTWSISPYIALDLEFSPDGSSLAVGCSIWGETWVGSQFETLKLFNVSSGIEMQNFIGHTNAVSSVLFSQDGTWMASGSWDNSIKIWNISNGNEIYSLENHSHIVSSIALSSDELTLVSGSFDNTLNIWNVSSGELLENLVLGQEVWAVDFSDNSSILAAAVGDLVYFPNSRLFWESFGVMRDGSIQIWDVSNIILLESLVGHTHIIESIDFSPDGAVLASASWDWTIKLWGDKPSLSGESQSDPWPTSTPEAQWVDSAMLNAIGEEWKNSLHSLVVIRHGKLIFERYYSSFNHIYAKESKHVLFSATKSFTSALIGIAIKKGFINSINQYVLDFFPEYNFSNVDYRKMNLTIKHLLTMTTGLSWHEEVNNDDLRTMYFALDSLKYVLDKPMVSEPGEYFRYNSGASHLLSVIIQKVTGKTTLQFAFDYLFNPLGIEKNDVIWMADSDGNNYGGISLFLTPRNMAKLGQLYLDEGQWRGDSLFPEQIIHSQWIAMSSRNYIEGLPVYSGHQPYIPMNGYGFQWWISDSLNGFSAEGYQGQSIFVSNDLDLVVIITANALPPPHGVLEQILDAVLVLPETITFWISILILPVVAITLFLFRKKIFRLLRKKTT